MKETIDQKAIKNARKLVQRLITNASIIAIFVALSILLLVNLGVDIDLRTQFVSKVAIPSVLLALSNLILYELWLKNGTDNAKSEPEYIQLIQEYQSLSENLNSDTMQEYLDAEKDRRYLLEYNRISKVIEKKTKEIEFLETSDLIKEHRRLHKIKRCKKKLSRLYTSRENVVINLPFTTSEQFDQLRYASMEFGFKEYKPSDTKRYLISKRSAKYISLTTFSLLSLNLMSATVACGNNWLVAIFMTVLSAASLMAALISGFSNGYSAISVFSTGVYNTAKNFISKARAYCNKHNKSLYATCETIADNIPNEKVKNDTDEEKPSVTFDIFSMK